MRFAPLVAFLLSTLSAEAQPSPACSSPEYRQLDFWVGEWDLSWPGGQGGTPAGQSGIGENIIAMELGDCVIHESFHGQGFSGQSLSIYDSLAGEWKQTWVDDAGGHIRLSGGLISDLMEFRTAPFQDAQGETRINRMIWEDIAADSLTWRWQTSLDGGETWSDVWVIAYERR